MEPTFYDLPPEVLSLIFGYTAGVELVEISSLFRIVIPILSKHLLHSLHDYIQQTALEIDQTECRDLDTRTRAMAWACRKKIKIRKCHFVFKSSIDLCISEYVLRSCDISNLESFGLYYHGERVVDENNSLLLMKQGFPFEVAYDIDRVKSRDNLMGRIVDVLIHSSDNKKIRKLFVAVDLCLPNIDWMLRLLQSVPCLEEFHLSGYFVWGRNVGHQRAENNVHNILTVIEALPCLRTLELINIECNHSLREKVSLKLVSRSLEHVSLYQSYHCVIEECVCPNLKVLCIPLSYKEKLVSKLEGKFPYGMQVRKVCDVIPSWNDVSDVCVQFDFMTRPIQGYVCPDTCTVLVIPNAMEVSYDGDYYGSELQDDDYEYLQDSEEEEDDDDYYEDEVDYDEDDELDNDLMSVTDYFDDAALLDEGEEDYDSHRPQAFF